MSRWDLVSNKAEPPGAQRIPGRTGQIVDYDSELQRYDQRLRQAYHIGPEHRVLDVGCGAGQTTREAARMATAGSAHGVDVSPDMIQQARDLARTEGLGNVTFQLSDAATSRFPDEPFDIAISRFGTMFFEEPMGAICQHRPGLRS
jgi:ubiquinone/menaquinone biosynthesis C-methylase UbiE